LSNLFSRFFARLRLRKGVSSHLFGKRGEQLASSFLKKRGYRIVERGYRSRFGEIDIIAYDKETLCFIEVKSRRSQEKGLPEESIPLWKRKRIRKLAECYLANKGSADILCRFDVVAIYRPPGEKAEFKLIKNAF
jgi:putative endonuclease